MMRSQFMTMESPKRIIIPSIVLPMILIMVVRFGGFLFWVWPPLELSFEVCVVVLMLQRSMEGFLVLNLLCEKKCVCVYCVVLGFLEEGEEEYMCSCRCRKVPKKKRLGFMLLGVQVRCICLFGLNTICCH